MNINDFAKKAYKYYISQGMTPEGAVGLMGNQYYESDGFVAGRIEYLCLQRLRENGKNYTQESYVKAVDTGKISKAEFLNPLPGRIYGAGLCQWTTPYPRKSELYDRTVGKGLSLANEQAQLEYTVYELKTRYPSVWKTLTTTTSIKTASDVVLRDFEVPDNWSSQSQTRYQFAKEYYDYFKSTTTTNNKGSDVMTKTEKAIQWMENTAADNSHGYSQSERWGERGDYDCSSAVITAWQNAGVPVKTNGATYTGNMYDVFTKCGFRDVTKSVDLATGTGLKRGDILLNHQHHVAMYCGNGKEVEASINEKGTATGGIPGDQTGREFLIRSYRNYPWNAILRYPEATSSTSSNSSTPNSSSTWSGTLNQSCKVRTWAGSEYSECSFSPMKKGTAVEVQYAVKDTKNRDWYLVRRSDGLQGFVLGSYVSKKTTNAAAKKMKYRVQCGCYSVKANAKTTQSTLKKYGYSSEIITVDGQYIVQCGLFDNLDKANAYCDKIKADGFEAFVIAVKE